MKIVLTIGLLCQIAACSGPTSASPEHSLEEEYSDENFPGREERQVRHKQVFKQINDAAAGVGGFVASRLGGGGGGGERPPTPPPIKLPDDYPHWLESEEEDEELTDGEEDLGFDYDIADLTANHNVLPENMVPFIPSDDGRNEMFPMGLRAGGDGSLPIDPRHEYVSYEQCTAAERVRLTNLIEAFELRSQRFCRRRCETKQVYREYRIKKTKQFDDAHEKYHTNDNFARLEVLKDRKRKKMATLTRRWTRLWARARRQQTLYSQRLQAVVNGIAYREEHPDRTFVIYLRERDVVLQRTQTLPPPAAQEPREPRQRPRRPTTPMPPATTERILHRHRELRRSRSGDVDLEKNKFNFGLEQPTPAEYFCDCLVNDFGEWRKIKVTKFRVASADSVFDLFGLEDGEPKIILTPKNTHREKLEERCRGVRNLFDLYHATLEGWNRHIDSTREFLDSSGRMGNLEKLVLDSTKPDGQKLQVLDMVAGAIMRTMDKKMLWYYDLAQAQKDVFDFITIGINRLI